MKALSIKQPWAELIVSGKKQIEVRSWKTEYRGPLLIHASQEKDYNQHPWQYLKKGSHIDCGGIVGVGYLYSIIELNYGRWISLERLHLNQNQQFGPGLYGWVFSAVSRLPFFSVLGSLGLFNVLDLDEKKISLLVRCGENAYLTNPKLRNLEK